MEMVKLPNGIEEVKSLYTITMVSLSSLLSEKVK